VAGLNWLMGSQQVFIYYVIHTVLLVVYLIYNNFLCTFLYDILSLLNLDYVMNEGTIIKHELVNLYSFFLLIIKKVPVFIL
jgi:hypothetical protein